MLLLTEEMAMRKVSEPIVVPAMQQLSVLPCMRHGLATPMMRGQERLVQNFRAPWQIQVEKGRVRHRCVRQQIHGYWLVQCHMIAARKYWCAVATNTDDEVDVVEFL
jgi:hypothetical protein